MKKLVLFLLISLNLSCLDILEQISSVDITEIKERGRLTAITTYGSGTYFLYRGKPMGLEYELLSRFAAELDVKLDIRVTRDIENARHMLNSGEGDIVAAASVVTIERAREVQFTEHLYTTSQVLVQRQGPNVVRNVVDLIGKKVHVRRNSHYIERLNNLSNEIGGEIQVIEEDHGISTEDLIKKVANLEIDFTVSDENIALMNQTYLPQIDVSTRVSFPQRVAWVVRKKSADLLEHVNRWVQKVKKAGTVNYLYKKYYETSKVSLQTEYHSLGGGKLSAYDKQIQKAAVDIGWDWRLLAALVFQESRFIPNARSWAGAVGLMQVMPGTGYGFGARNLYDPNDNIKTGSAYIQFLQKMWMDKISDPEERLKFILASYNAGPGHVEDARKLTRAAGNNPDIWHNNVEKHLLTLSEPEFYNLPIIEHGYCRGEEPVKYVRAILERYNIYKKIYEPAATIE